MHQNHDHNRGRKNHSAENHTVCLENRTRICQIENACFTILIHRDPAKIVCECFSKPSCIICSVNRIPDEMLSGINFFTPVGIKRICIQSITFMEHISLLIYRDHTVTSNAPYPQHIRIKIHTGRAGIMKRKTILKVSLCVIYYNDLVAILRSALLQHRNGAIASDSKADHAPTWRLLRQRYNRKSTSCCRIISHILKQRKSRVSSLQPKCFLKILLSV